MLFPLLAPFVLCLTAAQIVRVPQLQIDRREEAPRVKLAPTKPLQISIPHTSHHINVSGAF